MKNKELQGNKQLYTHVKSFFIDKETTFSMWCKEQKISRTWAIQTLLGQRNGKAAKALRLKIAIIVGILEKEQKEKTNV